MSERCPACDAIVDDVGAVVGGPLRCDKCGTRFPKPKKAAAQADGKWNVKDDVDGLGIHPALAKKHRDRASLPPVISRATQEPSEIDPRDTDPNADSLPPPPVPPPLASPGAPTAGTRVLVESIDVIAAEPGTTNPGRPQPRRSIERAHDGAPPQGKAPALDRAAAPPPRAASQPRQEPVDPVPIIPGYACTELVGKGAMGRVYRASQVLPNGTAGRASAIKILTPELAARQDFIQRFEREGAAMRAVNHPGVVAVMDQGSARQPDASTAHYICMEFVEGPPLRRSLDKGPLAPEVALRYARLIIQGLGAAHARGVIHRDLKPENILVHSEERLVLVDFGLAGMLDEQNDPHPNLTKSRMTMGTVNYMAPEQRTDAKRVDQRADLYAAGVILYELLTGDLPLGRFALPTERGVTVPLSVDRCIVRALARNPDERYQHAAQFDEDLRAIEAELRRTAAQDTVIGRARSMNGGGTGNQNRKAALDDDSAALMLVPFSGASFSGVPSAVTAPPFRVHLSKRSLRMLTYATAALVVGALIGIVVKLVVP
ncbi:MAG TPA: serine/threonine-protein kinase [Myxococcota bacterium]